jgi:hypothetical protein
MLVDPIERRASTVRGAGSASTVRGAGAARTVRGAGNEPGIFHAAIRAVSGHSYPFLRIERFCVPLTERDLPSLSALVHVTRPHHLTAIMQGWHQARRRSADGWQATRVHVRIYAG